MYREKQICHSEKWKHRLSTACLLGMLCLALVGMQGMISGVPAVYADGVPGGNIADPVVRAVDIAKPAVVRIITIVIGQLNVTFPNGQSVSFPTTPQNGANGYPLALSGAGAFISAHGDLLTADHVVNPPKNDLDQFLDQLAGRDVANYINQNLKPTQPVSPDQASQELASGQLQSASQYQQPQSRVYLSTDFSGSLNAPDFQSIPANQFAAVDQIKQQSLTNERDVAIIHVNGMDDMPMLQLDDSSSVQQQDDLKIIGFPGNGDVSTSPTNLLTSSVNPIQVSSIKTTDNGAPVIQVSGNVEQGDSGGPALDTQGHVVGVVSFSVVATSGSTSFLQASNSAKSLIAAAGVSTTPSAFQQLWSKAFTDYASKAPGHWHQARQEFQQITTQYPRFKAIAPFLQYATQQAQTEQQTAPSGSTNIPGVGALNPMIIIIGGGALLLILLVGGGLAVSRRRQPAAAGASFMGPGQMQGYNSAPASHMQSMPGQSYGMLPTSASGNVSSGQNMPGGVPQTPAYSQQPGYQNPAVYGLQQSHQPQQVSPSLVSQQNYQPQAVPQTPVASGMAAFGAPTPPVTPPPSPAPSDSTLLAPRAASSNAQWRTWPCGHTNRFDARFCGICGESAPPVSGVQQQ
ncbi:MAG TPA: trypsin-like peptidase domain-containing protein [Ktedonobacteraceae bacterium]|nr:trypsin-like peptidase domain-containing protein [Ktedonobacteraceae bacterium]